MLGWRDQNFCKSLNNIYQNKIIFLPPPKTILHEMKGVKTVENKPKIIREKNRTKYLDDYKKEHYKKYNLIIKKTDVDVIAFLDALPNKTKFITEVVREILKKQNN